MPATTTGTTTRVLRIAAAAICFSALVPPASAGTPASCEPFVHAQTYRPDAGFFQAPAWHYGGTVTIVYSGTRCRSDDPAGTTDRYDGTATIFLGAEVAGDAVAERPFASTETRSSPTGGPSGATWWTCDGGTVEYVWAIDGVYRFVAFGAGGRWTFRQSSLGPRQKTRGHSFSACRGRR